MSNLPSILSVEAFTQAVDAGRIFTVTFIKRTNGERRVMNCRRGVQKGVSGAGRAFDPGPKALLPVYDMQAEGHRFVSLDSLISLKLGGREYEWTGEAFVERELVAA